MNRLRELRKSKKYTLDDIEKQTGINRGTYNNYESGKTSPKPKTWQALANFFNVPVDYLKGYGYSKEHIYKCLDDAYKEPWIGKSNLLGVDLIPAFYIEKYCKQNKISIPKDTDLKFWQDNFNFIFDYKEIKRLLTTKDSYTDDEIKEMVTLALFQKTTDKKFVSFIEKVNEQYLKNLQNKTNK